MDYICQYCDRFLIENPEEYENYLTTSRKKNDKNLYTNFTIIILALTNSIKY